MASRYDDDIEPEVPSEEELGALFADDGGSGDPSLRILVVSRRDEDLKTLTAVLAENRVDLSLARNPFTALDYLRARDFHGLITDLGIWAERGALLFDRLRFLDRHVPVALIVEAEELETWAADRRVDAVIARPLDLQRSRRALGELCSRWRAASGAAVPEPPRPARPATAVREVDSPPQEGPGARGPWYQFFFEVRRRSRLARDRDARRELFLASFLAASQAGGVGLSLEDSRENGRREAVRIDLRLALAPGPGEAGLRRDLLHVLAEIPAEPDRESPELPAGEALVLPVLLSGGLAWLVAVPRADQPLPVIPDEVLEEIPFLVAEILAADPPRRPR